MVVFEDTRYSKEVVLQYFFLFKGKKVWIDFFGQVCVSAQNLQFQKKYQQKRIILSRVKNAALKNTWVLEKSLDKDQKNVPRMK